MELRNYTPHAELTYVAPDGSRTVLPQRGNVRCQEEHRSDGAFDSAETLPRTLVGYGDPDGLPDPEPDVLFVVSQLVVNQCPERGDLVFPSGLLRDQDGSIIGFERLARPLVPQAIYDPDGPVFFSYRTADGLEQTDCLDELLQALGIPVWRDVRDLQGGNIEKRLDQALTSGLSGAVLVVTPDICSSDIVRRCELPRLLEASQGAGRFELVVANGVPLAPSAHPAMDTAAPENLLPSAGQLAALKQFDICDMAGPGVVDLARVVLKDYLDGRLARHPLTEGTLTIDVQTRLAASQAMTRTGDLCIRLDWAAGHTFPQRSGLVALMRIGVILSNEIYGRGVRVLRLTGGMHLSVGLTLGALFTSQRPLPRKLECEHTSHGRISVWASNQVAPAPRELESWDEVTPLQEPDATLMGVAVLVTLSPNAHMAPFQEAVSRLRVQETHRWCLADIHTPLNPEEGANLAVELGKRIRELAARCRGDVHLFFQGPWPMAVLLGRQLNTVSLVVYELDEQTDADGATRREYVPALRLQPGSEPIQEVLLPVSGVCG
ncbi:MAG: SAVED domain-containing protein [Propioniciclava sp.]